MPTWAISPFKIWRTSQKIDKSQDKQLNCWTARYLTADAAIIIDKSDMSGMRAEAVQKIFEEDSIGCS
jgi:hypothetical protein